MRTPTRRALLLITPALAVVVAAESGEPRAAPREETLAILTRSGPVTFTVELASTPEQRARDLMFRKELPERHGMLSTSGSSRRGASGGGTRASRSICSSSARTG